MIEIAVVWWLLIDSGGAKTSPVFLPAPFSAQESCIAAGEAFKESRLDVMEMGEFACLPQPEDRTDG